MKNCAYRNLSFVSVLILFFAVGSAFSVTRTVTSSANAGANTLRDLIGASSDGDVIEFDASITTITLATEIDISVTLTITGPAADELTISGGSSSRIFLVTGTGKTVNISGIRFLNGRSQTTPIINFIVGGGAISHSNGILNIDECEFEGNVCDDGNGTTSFGYGGAIVSHSELNVTNSLFYNNSVSGTNAYGGGGVYCQDNGADHDVTFNNCTFYSNSVTAGNAAADGGGLYIAEEDPGGGDTAPLAEITNCTFYDNRSSSEGEQLHITNNGGDVGLVLRNNIFDNSANTAIQSVTCDCAGGLAFTTNGGNIYWDTPDTEITTGGTRDQVSQGIDGSGLTGSLGAFGGPTRTIPVNNGSSLADDNGVSGGPTLARDQRDFNREGNPDSGAFEFDGTYTFHELFPLDDATGVSVTSNLVITFDHNVTIGSGNLQVLRVADDGVVETIAVGSGAVTGGGTKVITVNPTSNLPGNTAVYVNYPTTAFDAPRGEANVAVSGNSTWNFTTGAPVNTPPVIATSNTVISGARTGENQVVFVTVSDLETSTSDIILTATSGNTNIVPDANIIQLGLTSATSSFRITTASLATFGTVSITITATDTNAGVSSTTFNVTFGPSAPSALAYSLSSPLNDPGFNVPDASGFGNRFILQVGANANRESSDILVTTGTFNAFGQLSAPSAVVQTEYTLFTGFGGASVGDGSGPAPATFGPSVASTVNTIRTQLQDRFARGANLTLSTASGAPAVLSNTTVSVTILLPETSQIGLTSTFGNTSGAAGAGVGIDGFNGGVTNFSGTTTVTVTMVTLDAANYIAATGNHTFPIFFFTTTVTASVDNPDFVLSGAGTTLSFSPIKAIDTGSMTITYNGSISTTAVITFTHAGSGEMGTTSVTISVDAVDPIVATSNTVITMKEDQGTSLYVSVFDGQSATSLIVLTGTSSNINLVATSGITQVSSATTAITCFSITNAIANTNGTVNITITGTDPESNTGSTTFSVTITPVNDAPSFSTGATVTVEEGAASYDLPFATGITDGDPEVDQTLTFHLLVDNPALFNTQPTIAVTNGNIRFGVAANTVGTVNVMVSLSDNGGTSNCGINTTATQSFVIVVNNLNDAPVFSTGSNVTVAEDSPQYQAAFATGVDDGDPTTTQSLTFHVVATNPTLFAQQPFISTSNNFLFFRPASNAFGTTAVLVSLSDDGPNGGGDVNTSATQTFFITITPVNDAPTISPLAGAVTIDENSTTNINFSIADIDNAIGDLKVTATSSNISLVTNGGLTFGATMANMTMNVRPNCGATGSVNITVTVDDCGSPALTTTAVFQVNIDPVPSFVISGDAAPCPRTTVEYTMPPISGSTYTWAITNGILISGQGTTVATVNWESGTTGTVFASVQTPAGCTFNSLISVTTINIAANPDFAETGTGASVTFNVLTNDDGSSLTLIGATDPPNGSLVTNANGSVTYTPDNGFAGFDSFNYTIRDGNGCLETGASVQVVVSNEIDQIAMFFVEQEKDRQNGVRGLRGARGTAVSPDGKHVYATGQLDHSIPYFTRDSSNGELAYVNRIRNKKGGVTSMRNPTGIAVSPDGKHVYVAAYGNGAVVSFTRNSGTGALTFLEAKRNGKLDAGKTIAGISRPIDLAMSLDGKTIYVIGYTDNSIAVFRRDPNSGLLQYVERHKDGVAGVDGMRYPLGLDVSPDGENVYVASTGDDAVAVFDRNSSTGELTYSARLKDGNGGIDGIADASDVVTSSDGDHVYVAGYGDEAIAAFDRDGNGDLTYNSKVDIGLLDGVYALASAPNGAHVFGVAELDDAIVSLERDKTSGELTYLEGLRDGVGGVDALNAARDISLSPDGRFAYTAAFTDKAVGVFYRNRLPIAKDDDASTCPSCSTEVMVLTNDVENDPGETLTVTGKTDGANGTVSISGGSTTVTYTNSGTDGVDSFTYTISDGKGGSSTATVTVFVGFKKSGPNANAAHADTDIRVNPNPVRDMATIHLNGLSSRELTVSVLDMSGRRVATLFNGKVGNSVQMIWNARSYKLPAGGYSLVVERLLESGEIQQLHTPVRVVR